MLPKVSFSEGERKLAIDGLVITPSLLPSSTCLLYNPLPLISFVQSDGAVFKRKYMVYTQRTVGGTEIATRPIEMKIDNRVSFLMKKKAF